jgi:hypothetical protein
VGSAVLSAAQVAVDPPLTPEQVQVQGPVPAKLPGTPEAQAVNWLSSTGGVENVLPFAVPQTPLITGLFEQMKPWDWQTGAWASAAVLRIAEASAPPKSSRFMGGSPL